MVPVVNTTDAQTVTSNRPSPVPMRSLLKQSQAPNSSTEDLLTNDTDPFKGRFCHVQTYFFLLVLPVSEIWLLANLVKLLSFVLSNKSGLMFFLYSTKCHKKSNRPTEHSNIKCNMRFVWTRIMDNFLFPNLFQRIDVCFVSNM